MKMRAGWMAAALALVLSVSPAAAYVPQTIVIDGINDFNAGNLIDADGGDTETKNWCTSDPEDESPMDIKNVYVTNDASFLYIGFEYDKDCFNDPAVNLGIAIDLNTPAGGTTDPFARQIAWGSLVNKPDYILYDVLNAFNYEVFYEWDGATWANVSTRINPSWGGGSNGLGIADGTTFIELKIPFTAFNPDLAAGQQINLEFWMTQDNTNKGPLDAVCSDGVQLSTPAGTTFEVTLPIQMTCMLPYTVQTINDTDPPTVSGALATGFTLLPTKQFALTTRNIDVTFSEPVDPVTAQVAGNYVVSNGASAVSSALRDPVVSSVVHLTLVSPIGASANFYNVTVTGVKDIAGNTIVANGTTNVASFFQQNLRFEGDMAVPLCKGVFAPVDTFAVEGSLPPLTFAMCDNALATDPDVDSVYVTTVPFCMPKNAGTGKAEANLQWKFSNKCVNYEPRSDRTALLSSDNGAADTLRVFWNDDDPVNFTTHGMDVIFQVDASPFTPGALDTIELRASESPLSFDPPVGVQMKDDGVSPDQAAGDGIYTVLVRFPQCTRKYVEWKVLFNGVYECEGQGNRSFTLNEAVSDTVGGPLGPLRLPARDIDRCTVTDKGVRVVFRVNAAAFQTVYQPGDTIAVMAARPPLSFDAPPPAAGWLKDDGLGFDETAGDFVFTGAVDFPDSTESFVEYKFWRNGVFECPGAGNRTFTIDDLNYSIAVPQVRPVNLWDWCSDEIVAVEPLPGPRTGGTVALLAQNLPNPFRGSTVIRFELKQPLHATISVYDVAGRRVTTLLRGEMPAGLHTVSWNGRDLNGQSVKSGIYFYELATPVETVRRHMVVLR